MYNFLLESSVCIVVFYLVYFIWFRNDQQFTRNRYYLLAGLVFSLIIPLLSFRIGQVPWKIPAPILTQALTEPIVATPQYVEASVEVNWLSVFYWVGCSLAAVYFLFRVFTINTWIRKCNSGWVENKKVYFTNGSLPTASIFNIIFWDNSASYQPEEVKAILAHEDQHIKQFHSMDIIMVELLQIVLWFNPIMYLYKKSMKQQHEYLADAAAAKLISSVAYQQLMINEVSQRAALSLPHYFGTSTIKKRILMLNQKTDNMLTRIKSLIIIPAVALLIFVYSCEQDESIGNQIITENIKGFDISRELVEKDGKFFIEGVVTNAEGNPAEEVGLVFPGEDKVVVLTSGKDGSYALEWDKNKPIKDIKIRVFVAMNDDEKVGEEEKMAVEYEKVIEGEKTFLVGKVMAKEGNKAMPGVNVVLNGTKKGTISNLEGSFKLEVPSSGTITLSFVGFVSEQIIF